MRYIIKRNHSSNNTIFLPSKDIENFSLVGLKTVIVRIGVISQEVTLSEHHEDNYLYMSSDLFANFTLPEFLEFELKVKEGVLYIGPVIGMLIRGKVDEMTSQRIKIYKNYLTDYQHVNGLILLITVDGIDWKRKVVIGYAYNPKENEWIKGIYPFPSSVFLRKTIKESTRRKLNNLIENKYFNSNVFNKWDMWVWFSNDEMLSKFFAKTVLGENIQGVHELLREYGSIFIKPMSGMQGTGIFQLSKNEKSYSLSYRKNGNNFNMILDNWKAVEHFLNTELYLFKYIAQQRIPLLRHEGRVIDYRAIAIKDKNGKWSVPGIVTKYGEKESIVSNISSGGSAEKAWDSLMKLYQENHRAAFLKYKEIENLAISCCKTLEDKGLHLAYIGIDIGMDEEGNLWVIEINNRNPDMTIALDAEDFQLYYNIKAAPLHYAKWLAGFGGSA